MNNNNNNIRNLNEIKTNSSIKYKKINKNLSTNNIEFTNSHKKNLKSSSSLKYNRHLINSHKLYSSNSVSSNINRLSTISSENLITNNNNSSSKRISSIENKIKNKLKNKENKSIRYLSTSSSPKNHRNFSNKSISLNKKKEIYNKKMLLFSDAKKNSVIKLNKDLHNLNLKNKRTINNSNLKSNNKKISKNIKNILKLQSQNSSLLISPKTERQTINYNNTNNKSNLLTINSNKKTINNNSKNNYKNNISPISKLNNLILSISPRKSKRSLNNLSNNINNNYHTIEIFLISNYGHKYLIGLKNVKLISNYNLNCQILKFSYKNCKIINDKENIILGLNSELKPSFEIIFTLPNNHKLRDIIINNYKGKDKTICIKNIEIFYENKVIFLGKISQNSNLILQEINKKKFKYKFSPIKKIIVNRKIKNNDYVNNNNKINNDMKIINKTFKHINSLDDIKKEYKNNINIIQNNNNLNIKFQRFNSNILNNSNSLDNFYKLDNNNNKINYINCDKIKITFLENFLNNNNNNNFNKKSKNKIDITNNNILYGLTGIQFYIYDENENVEKEFLIDNFKSINSIPKDINTCMNLINDERIFKNLFNKSNKTNNDNNMWLTIKIKNFPFIEFISKKSIKLTKIKFWNWNEKNSIENGIKIFNLNLFKNNNLIINSNFYLHKGIGENNCDYSQDIKFPFILNKLNEEEIKPYFNINMNHFNFGLIYNTPYLPFGFVLKFELINNYFNEEFIGFKSIKIFNQNGKEINNYKKIILPINSIIKCSNNNKIIMKFININVLNNELKNVYDCNKNNRIYFIFNDPIGISLINIENFNNNKENFSLKDIKILLDDNIIYEAKLKKGMNSIIFTGNKKILKLIDVNNLNLIEDSNKII